MDRITDALLKEFSSEFSLGALPEEDRFEHFAALIATRRHFSEASFNPSAIVTGKGNDTGIDSIAIIVNNNLISDVDTVEDLLQVNNYLDVTFVFTQAERSSHFDMAKIGQFGFGVNDFFGEGKLPRNDAVKACAEIMKAIYSHSSRFRPSNPSCHLYYITTGKWNSEAALVARATAEVESLKSTGMFGAVKFTPLGADQVQKLYRQTKNEITREFQFDKRVVVPEVSGVSEAHLGFLKASEFLKLVCDEDGEIIKSLFYENVRDWVGYNQINREMREALTSSSRDRFVLMNNGVTMIAHSLRQTGDKFTITNYQVVNGCQTSHVLHDNQGLLTDSVRIPLRLIGTQEEDVIESIIKATNRQTEVKEDEFFAMKGFAKKLEDYFKTFLPIQRVFYERRPHQYDSQEMDRLRIIGHQNLVRAVGAMFLGEPHVTTKNFSQLRAKVGKEMFVDTDKFEPYYVAAFSIYRLEMLFKARRIDSRLKAARYQIMLAVRFLMDHDPLPRLGSTDISKRCNAMMQKLWHEDAAQTLFEEAAAKIEVIAGEGWDRDSIRTEAVTKAIFNSFGQKYKGA